MVVLFTQCEACKQELHVVYESPSAPTDATLKALKHCESGQVLSQTVATLVTFEARRTHRDPWVNATPIFV